MLENESWAFRGRHPKACPLFFVLVLVCWGN